MATKGADEVYPDAMDAADGLGSTARGGRQRRAVQPGAVRAHNLSVVLEQVRLDHPLSRARIAERVGLTRGTVSDLVEQLVTGGMLVESGSAVGMSGVGRPGVALTLARGRFVALGLDVQADAIHAMLVDLGGETLVETRWSVDLRTAPPEEALRRVAEVATPLVDAAAGFEATLVGVGVAVPGLVMDGSVVGFVPNLGWRAVDVATPLRDALGWPVLVGNDASLGVRAELLARRVAGLPEPQSLFFVDANVGIGGALVVDGQPVTGQHGWGNEIGHVNVEPEGPPCACGSRGCLEAYAGLRALVAGAGLPPGASSQALVDRLASGDAAAQTAVSRAGEKLGGVLANALNLMDVDLVVLGGSFAALGPHLVPRLERMVADRVLFAQWHSVRIEAARTGLEAGALGAALSVLDTLFANPQPWLTSRRTVTHSLRPGGFTGGGGSDMLGTATK